MKQVFFAAILASLVVGCSGGFVYKDAQPLEFADFDYGFPTKSALANPAVSFVDVGSGPETIVLVHGLASNAGFWRYNISELAKTFRVIAVDLPGYGKSQKGVYPYDMKFYAETIFNLLQSLNIDKVNYVGHSMGGQIGITLALSHPEKINKLILLDPAGVEAFEKGEGNWLRSVVTMDYVKITNEEGIRRNLALNFYTWDEKWEWMVEERARMAKAKEFDDFAYAVVRSVHGMLVQPTSKKLENISQPTLIAYGKHDGLIPNPYLHPGFTADVFEVGAKRIPNCRLVEIPDAGHMVQIEQSEMVNRTIDEFCK
jgi:pimeloyl-ACP methyl ester carboxylesterase